MPKTAGTSLRKSIENIVGEENVYSDYNAPFVKNGPIIRKCKNIISSFFTNKITNDIIFGHFFPCKYCDLKINGFHKRINHKYLVFLRDPLQRAISNYYYWERFPDPSFSICNKIAMKNFHLEDFLLSNYFSNFYSKFFFGFPIENFDYVGISEKIDSSIKLLSKMFPEFSKIQITKININKDKLENKEYQIDENLELKFKKLNKKDYIIYKKAKEINSKLFNLYIT